MCAQLHHEQYAWLILASPMNHKPMIALPTDETAIFAVG